MAVETFFNLPSIRACIFDMDGLLINSEDIITLSINQLLEKYERPPLTRSIRTRLMGIPNSTNGDLFHNWATLPISREQFARESASQMRHNFSSCEPLPGAVKLLENLSHARNASGDIIRLALAPGTKTRSYQLKTSRPETERLLGFFPPDRRVLGDDPRVRGRGKPAPDIYLVALQSLNSTLDQGEKDIRPDECLVFEDSVVGVEAARRAGMRVIWVPHPDVVAEYQGKERGVLAEGIEIAEAGDDRQLGSIDDTWAESMPTLETFDYGRYGITVLP
ncbi:putative HAD superfamily hydrolase [Rostrohypoxylon terebratum]|nr:putative HAD superfamily hydrolase [Rostrohypoxylon terebratum]